MSQLNDNVSSKNGDSSNYINDLTFLSQQPTKTDEVAISEPKTKTDQPETTFSRESPKIGHNPDLEIMKDDDKMEKNLINELKFISQTDSSDEDVKKPNTNGNGLKYNGKKITQTMEVAHTLKYEVSEGVDGNTAKNLEKTSDDQSESNLADELAFIRQDLPDDVINEQQEEKQEDAKNLVDELHLISRTTGTSEENEIDTEDSNGTDEKLQSSHDIALISKSMPPDEANLKVLEYSTNGGQSTENLAGNLAFITHDPKQEKKINENNNTQNGEANEKAVEFSTTENLADELAFISNDPMQEKKVIGDLKTLNGEANLKAVEPSIAENIAGELDFITNDPKEENNDSEDPKTPNGEAKRKKEDSSTTKKIGGQLAFIAHDPKQGENDYEEPKKQNGETKQKTLVDELKFISHLDTSSNDRNGNTPNTEDKVDRDDSAKMQKLQSDLSNSTQSGNIPSKTSSLSDDKNDPSPIKHIVAIFAFSTVALLMTFAYLRIGLGIFCTYDDQLDTYIVMKKVEQCPIPIKRNDDKSKRPFWKKRREEESEELFEYIPAPVSKRREILCRGTFNVLHAGAALLHPKIHYKTVMPQVQIHSPCPEIPKKKLEKKRVLKKVVDKIAKIFRKKEKEQTNMEEAPKSTPASDNQDEFDWTFLVSVPLDLDLSSKQAALVEQLSEKVKESVGKNHPDIVNNNATFEELVEKVKFGGIHPWWAQQNDNEGIIDGLMLIVAYLKIMDWPDDLMSNFPASGICANGCPADFSISNTLEFRGKYQPWKITPAAVDENRLGWVYVRGYSPTRHHPDPSVGGASILWLSPGIFKMQNAEPYSRAIISSLDMCIADAFSRSGGKMGKCNVVLDCKDVGLSKVPPIGPTKTILKMMQDNYPDKLGVFVIANVSGAAGMFLKIVLPLLPQLVRQKIHILPNHEEKRSEMLKELIDEAYIPVRLGGKDDYKFNAETYYETIQKMTDEEGIQYHQTLPYYAP